MTRMTIEELEAACDASHELDFSRHEVEAPELSLCGVFYPLGFATQVRTNSDKVLAAYRDTWGGFSSRFHIDPIRIDVHVVDNDAAHCPPAPTYRMMRPLLIGMADEHNYSASDLERNRTHITVSQAALRHEQYLRHFFLDSAPLVHVATRHATPLHAGCVSLHGRGLLLCGDSGAGKSTLSYACARAGWTYITDDAAYLVHHGGPPQVTGNCRYVRLRPPAADFFPEIDGSQLTPRAEGKPSIEVPTSNLPTPITCSQTAEIDFMVFLNRRSGGKPELVQYRKDVAREFMRQVLYGCVETLTVQYEAIERLLRVDVLELRYTDLDWAVDRLQRLVEAGR